MERKNYYVGSINKAARILRCFSVNEPEWSSTELAKRLGMPNSTVHRMLMSLRAEEFVEQDETTGKFRLGSFPLMLSAVIQTTQSVGRIALPILEELSRLVSETVVLTIPKRQGHVCYEQVTPEEQEVRSMMCIGELLPYHAGATGKVLLAHSSDKVFQEILQGELKRYTPNTICDREQLLLELQQIRLQGYALSVEEKAAGGGAVAVPIYNHLGGVVAAMGILVPMMRLDAERVDELASLAKDYGERLSSKLGKSPTSE
jgi:DNA-binding IclR family transcriptional regulator